MTRLNPLLKMGLSPYELVGLFLGSLFGPSIVEFRLSAIRWVSSLRNGLTIRQKVPVTFQSRCVVIFISNRIGDPRNRLHM